MELRLSSKVEQIRTQYLDLLRERLDRAAGLCRDSTKDPSSSLLVALRFDCHRTAGTAEYFGYTNLARVANEASTALTLFEEGHVDSAAMRKAISTYVESLRVAIPE